MFTAKTYEPPEEIHVDLDDVQLMNNGDIPLNAVESEIAMRDLDDPSGIQTNMNLNVTPTKTIRVVKKTPKTKLGMMFLNERSKRGWTQDVVAKKTGIDRREVSKIEQGVVAVPHIDKVNKLSTVYSMNTKAVLKVYAQVKRDHDKKRSDKNDLINEILDSTPPKPSTIEKNEIAVVSALEMSISKDKLIETLISIIKKKSPGDLCRISSAIGIPVTHTPQDLFVMKLFVHCPLCTERVGSENMDMSFEKPMLIDVLCPYCKKQFLVPYNAVLEMNCNKHENIPL